MEDYYYNELFHELLYKDYAKVDLKTLPSNLKILKLPESFNDVLDKDSFPKTLEVLVFGKKFNQKIKVGVLPTNLKVLIFGDEFNKVFCNNTLPEKLKILRLGYRYNKDINFDTIPANLEVLQLENYSEECLEEYPFELKKFIFNYESDNSYYPKFDLNKLPKTIEFLDFNCKNHYIEYKPFTLNLKILKIDAGNFNYLYDLPPSLKYIEIYYNKRHNFIDNYTFPDNLEYLVLGDNIINPYYNRQTQYYCNRMNDINMSDSDEYDEDDITDLDNKKNIFQEKIKKIKYLSIDGNKKQKYLLNNLPIDLEIIKFNKLEIEISNLPINVTDIYLKREEDIKYITKIPFGCNIHTNFRIEPLIIEGYIVNSKSYYKIDNVDNIEENIKKLDSIGCQYYNTFL